MLKYKQLIMNKKIVFFPFLNNEVQKPFSGTEGQGKNVCVESWWLDWGAGQGKEGIPRGQQQEPDHIQGLDATRKDTENLQQGFTVREEESQNWGNREN